MEPPQLRCAEAPMRTSLGAPVPMFVDESVGNIRIQECQELGGASRRKRRVHGPANYSLKLYLSAKSGEQHIPRTTCLLHITYTETRNTLFYPSLDTHRPAPYAPGQAKPARAARRKPGSCCEAWRRLEASPGLSSEKRYAVFLGSLAQSIGQVNPALTRRQVLLMQQLHPPQVLRQRRL
jgi:hypothetical protein